MTRALACVLAALLCAAAPAPAAIDMSGSTTAQPLVADLAYFYRQAVRKPPRFVIVGGGSEVGIADVARGITDAGMVGRGLLPADPAGLVLSPIAASAVCLVTNAANRVPGLTRAQVQGLADGSTGSWSQVPGAARADAIARVGFALGTGTASVFAATFVDPGTVLAPARVFARATQVRAFVRATPAAWGYADLAFARWLHTVPYEGVPCTRATVADGSYPGRRELALVTRGAPSGGVARFLRWIRTSATARRVIATRYVPLT